MKNSLALERLQPYLSNRLGPLRDEYRWMAGIVGDHPSQYAKSPSLWNAAFQALGLEAIFVPFDVERPHVAPFFRTIREIEQVVGFSVTVPYKGDVIAFLDELDPKAGQIGAVNTVARGAEGQLVGYNTDGQGFMDMLTTRLPGQREAFVSDLKGRRVLVIGAGGAAKAVAFYLAEAIGSGGRLIIANRDREKARILAGAVGHAWGNATEVWEEEIGSVAPTVDLIVNASTKGQRGIRTLSAGRITCLEPYSALAPARPAEVPEESVSGDPLFYATWYTHSVADIQSNLRLSSEIVAQVPRDTAFVDVVYAPLETVMLAQARWSGHRTVNGKGMNIAQASDAFVHRVMRPHLLASGEDLDATYSKVFDAMAEVW